MPPQVDDFSEVSTEFVTDVNNDGTLELEYRVVFNNLHPVVVFSECVELYIAHEQMIDNEPVACRGRDLLLAYCYDRVVKKDREEIHRRAADNLYRYEPLIGAELIYMRIYCEKKMLSSMTNIGPRMRKDFLLRYFVVMVMKHMRPDRSIDEAVSSVPESFLAKLREAGYLTGAEDAVNDVESLKRLFERADNNFFKGQAQARHAASKETKS